jgi:dipeptidyl aminopeptidase/acylaminoacyl peptidase
MANRSCFPKFIIWLLSLLGVVFFTMFLFTCKESCRHQKVPSVIVSSGIPAIPDTLRKELSPYQNWRSAKLVGWARKDRGIFFLRRADETSQLFYVERPGEIPRQLTNSAESVLDASVCPAAGTNAVLFTQDSGGNENFQIYYFSLDSHTTRRLTGDHAQNDGIVWSNKGDRFAFSSNRRNGKDFDIYISDPNRPGSDMLTLSKGGSWSIQEWSPDDHSLLVSQYRSRTSSHLYVLNLKTGLLFSLPGSPDTVSQELGAWGPGGKGIFYTSDENSDFRCLRYFDTSSRKETLATSAIHWDIREIRLSHDRTTLVFMTNENGFSNVYCMDCASFSYRKISSLPKGIISGFEFHPSDTVLAMTVVTSQSPEEVYSVNLKTDSAVRWTISDRGGLNCDSFVGPVVLHYPTFDSVSGAPRPIPCLVYKPRPRKAPCPVLVVIHGGPESQFWPSFNPQIQFLINRLGIAVIAPNVRGSGGYGKTYLSLDNGYKREDALRDIGALFNWIALQKDFDSSRIAVMGGSYGGYLSLASMARYSGKLLAGIDEYGISNFITFLEHTAPYRQDLRRVEYGDERDSSMRRFLINISPITNVAHIEKPLLIIQGANDARVPLEESRQISDELRKRDKTVWFLVAGNEGHGFRKKSNQDYQDLVLTMFLQKYLLN